MFIAFFDDIDLKNKYQRIGLYLIGLGAGSTVPIGVHQILFSITKIRLLANIVAGSMELALITALISCIISIEREHRKKPKSEQEETTINED